MPALKKYLIHLFIVFQLMVILYFPLTFHLSNLIKITPSFFKTYITKLGFVERWMFFVYPLNKNCHFQLKILNKNHAIFFSEDLPSKDRPNFLLEENYTKTSGIAEQMGIFMDSNPKETTAEFKSYLCSKIKKQDYNNYFITVTESIDSFDFSPLSNHTPTQHIVKNLIMDEPCYE
jgi:hypothetical protein